MDLGLVRFSSKGMHKQAEHLMDIFYQKQISKVLGTLKLFLNTVFNNSSY